MENSSELLKTAESSSLEDRSNSSRDGEVSVAREAEGGFKNSVIGIAPNAIKAKGKIGLKKKFPLIAIILLLGGFVGFAFLSQAAMPFAIVSRLYEEFNTTGISSILRADSIFDTQLSTPEDWFGLSSYQKSSLEELGILNVDYQGGTVLFFRDNNDTWTGVVGSSQMESANPEELQALLANNYPDSNAKKFSSPFLNSAKEALENPDFIDKYTSASKTWRGGNAGWYDTSMTLNEQVHGLERSRFAATNANAVSRNLFIAGKANNLANKVTNKFTGRSMNEYIQEKMAGKNLGKVVSANSSSLTSSESLVSAGFKLSSMLNALSAITQVGCAGVSMVMKAQSLVSGYQSMQQFNLTSGYAESVQWVQAGVNDGDAMNEYNENLLLVDEETGKNAMQSQAMGALMSGEKVDSSAKELQAVSSQTAVSSLSSTSSGNVVSNMLMSLAADASDLAGTLTKCNKAAATLSVVSSAISVGLAAMTGGISGVIELAITAVLSAAIITGLEGQLTPLFNSVVEWIWEDFGKTLVQNAATDWYGPELGNMLVAGGNRYIGSNHVVGGGSLATKDSLLAYKQNQEAVIAKEADYERRTRSPFDTSSRYTFLGSLVYGLVPVATSTSVGTTLKNISSFMTNSVTKILPTASAIAETSLIDQIGECPNLENIGAVGDPTCVPYIVTDTSTFGSSFTPQKLAEIVEKLGGIKDANPETKGNFEIVEDSNFDKYMSYCGQRNADYGMADAGVYESIQDKKSNKWWAKIPIIGSIANAIGEMMSNGVEEYWINGAFCVAKTSTSPLCPVDDQPALVAGDYTGKVGKEMAFECFWQAEGRFYQAFAEYVREAENMQITKNNSIVAYYMDKYEKNPLDNSPEGLLARYSGLSKDDVEVAIGFIYGMNYIANYDPSTRLAFGVEEKTPELPKTEKGILEDETVLALEPKYISYNPLRNRVAVI